MSEPDDPSGDPPKDPSGDPPRDPAPTVEATTAAPEVFEEMPLEPAPPVLPIAATTTDDDLREAVGVPRKQKPARAERKTRDDKDDKDDNDKDDEHDDDAPLSPDDRARRRKLWLTLALAFVLGMIVLAFVFLGRANGDRLVFRCASDQITAEHGRGFPPWGTRTLDGPEWAAIAIPPQAECKTRETESEAELEGWYLDALVEQAGAKVDGHDAAQATPAMVDDAEKLLRQALLLARSPDRRDQRAQIERLLGNVAYWRGAARVKAAADALGDAAKLFDEATARKPRNLADSAAWADYAREQVGELHDGPESLRPPAPLGAPSDTARPTAPLGVALPVAPDAAMPADTITPPDAGVPSGGVLL